MKPSRYIRHMFFGLIFIVAACNNETEPVQNEELHDDEEVNVVELTDAQIENAGLSFGTVEKKQISGTIKVNGVLDVPPQQLVSISAPLGGFLSSTELLEGSRVKKGQAIAKIENLDFIQIQQDYLEARSSFQFAKSDYERQQELDKENVNSQKTLQQAKSNYLTWQAKFNGLHEKLKFLNLNVASIEQGNISSSIVLNSPINGYVTEVNVNIGKYVNPTDVLFEIVDTEHLHAELIVFEKDVPKLKIGQKVRFTLANETEERMATVYLIGREINEDRTVQIHCHIDKEDSELLPGMYLNALVEAGGALVPALPVEAIIDYQGKKYVFLLSDKHAQGPGEKKGHVSTEKKHDEEGKHFEMVPVEIGNSELGYTEITSSDVINKNAKVVIKGAYALLSKMKNSDDEGGHAH
ncbi:efflux RND transporter periplasmic adaptor subunit [Chryseolinea sp. H1M3-3]|uniref:efflux RND transporter periplasmic adaptor subunit n=1 Tax=Chryseolinea sp. H1M3-3 TaxID=3034144 RepID=UPI0023EC6CE2|nr:efflux RND transporter periplasmic adaptor subunit [Chryseolinea sp. H1M3-3]